MDGLGNELLAGAIFTFDQDGGVFLADSLNNLPGSLYRVRFSDDAIVAVIFFELAAKELILNRQPLNSLELPYRPLHFFKLERLRQIIERVIPDRLHRGFNVGVRGHDDDFGTRALVLHLLQHLQAVHPGQFVIGNYEVVERIFNLCQATLTITRGFDSVAERTQETFADAAHGRFIINNQDMQGL